MVRRWWRSLDEKHIFITLAFDCDPGVYAKAVLLTVCFCENAFLMKLSFFSVSSTLQMALVMHHRFVNFPSGVIKVSELVSSTLGDLGVLVWEVEKNSR